MGAMYAYREMRHTRPVGRPYSGVTPAAERADVGAIGKPLARAAPHHGDALALQLQRVVRRRGEHAARTAGARAPARGVAILARRIVVDPDAYAKGIGLNDASGFNATQLSQYFTLAVADDLTFLKATHGATSNELAECNRLLAIVKNTTNSIGDRIDALVDLVTEINRVWDAGVTSTSYDYRSGDEITTTTANPPNLETRYAQDPSKTWSKLETKYRHTVPPTMPGWQDDPDMRQKLANAFGPLYFGGRTTQVAPRGFLVEDQIDTRRNLNQLTWNQAMRVLPRPLLNLIFDVRYQLESTGGTYVDERTPDEQSPQRKVTTPNMPGTLRSWHTDSPHVLPQTTFVSADALPGAARTLHDHYRDTSAGGEGSSQKSNTSAGPIGYAEYTGTGSNYEHSTKIVLDYASKRVYLTLTHYQYWALIQNGTTYTFWDSGTQDLSQALGNFEKRFGKESATQRMMSPWFEILMP